MGVGFTPAYAGNIVHDVAVRDAEKRFTPAYAGNILRPYDSSGMWRVHPRVCGEYGTPGLRDRGNAGFTPAYAGNTRTRRENGR